MADLSRPQKLNGAYYYPNAYPVGDNRRQQNSSTNSEPSSRRSRIGCCCRCLCVTLITLILLVGIAMLVVYLLFFPKIPKYTVQDVKIQTLNVTGSSRSPAVDTGVTVIVRAYNPNKKIGIKYRSLNTDLFYSGTLLGSSSVPPFYQGKRNVTLLSAQIKGSKVPVSESTGSGLKSSLSKNSVVLNTQTTVKAKIKMGKLTTPAVTVRVNCALRVSSPSAAGGARLLGKSCSARVRKIW